MRHKHARPTPRSPVRGQDSGLRRGWAFLEVVTRHPLHRLRRGVLQLDMVPETRLRLAVGIDKGKGSTQGARQRGHGHVIRTPIFMTTLLSWWR